MEASAHQEAAARNKRVPFWLDDNVGLIESIPVHLCKTSGTVGKVWVLSLGANPPLPFPPSLHSLNTLEVSPFSFLLLNRRTRVISFYSSIVTISLSCTVSEILSLISQNFKRSRDPECTPYCPILQNCNMHNGNTLYFQSANQRYGMGNWIGPYRIVSCDPDHAHLGKK